MGTRELLHDRDGTLADERDRHRMGAHAVARGAAGGVGGAEASAGVSDENPRVRRSAMSARQIGFSGLMALVLVGCGGPLEGMLRVTSPDKRVDAVWMRDSGGGATVEAIPMEPRSTFRGPARAEGMMNDPDVRLVGIAFVAPTIIGLVVGYLLDRVLGSAPWLAMIGLGFGIAAGFVNLSRSVKRH